MIGRLYEYEYSGIMRIFNNTLLTSDAVRTTSRSTKGHVKQCAKVSNHIESFCPKNFVLTVELLQQRRTNKSSRHPLRALRGQGRGLCFLEGASGWNDEIFSGDDIVRYCYLSDIWKVLNEL